MSNKETMIDEQQLIRGMLQIAVLVLLESKPKYGAQLLIDLSSTPFASKVGTLYPLLNRMEQEETIVPEWQIERGKTPRKYYQISASGLSKLQKYREFLTQIHTFLGGQS